MRRRPSSCAAWACASASSTRHSGSRWATAPRARYGHASCAGRGCDRLRSSAITRWKSSRAASARCLRSPTCWRRRDCLWGGVVAVAAVWYGAEAALARAAGWHLSVRSPLVATRRSVAAALDRRLARARLRLARQSDAGDRAARRGVAPYGHRTGVTVYSDRPALDHPALGSPMNLGIAGRKAIVCASSRGLGRACALALAQAGCEVVVNGRDGKTLDATAAALRQATGAKVTAAATSPPPRARRCSAPAPSPTSGQQQRGPTVPRFPEAHAHADDGVIANMVVAIELTPEGDRPDGAAAIRAHRQHHVRLGEMPLAGLDLSSGARRPRPRSSPASRARLPAPTSRLISCCPAPSTPSGCTPTSWPMPRARAFRSSRRRPPHGDGAGQASGAPTNSAPPAPSCAPPRPATSPARTCSSTAAPSPVQCERYANKAGVCRPRRAPLVRLTRQAPRSEARRCVAP